jgi:hypothetical protein
MRLRAFLFEKAFTTVHGTNKNVPMQCTNKTWLLGALKVEQ